MFACKRTEIVRLKQKKISKKFSEEKTRQKQRRQQKKYQWTPLTLAQEKKDKEVALAKASAEAEAERLRALGKRDAALLAAEGEIAATKEKNNAQLQFLREQAALLRDNPGLLELLRIQNDLLKTEALATAAKTNPNVVLLTGQEGLEARRMNKGHAPQVPGAAMITTIDRQ
jgi:hypothetical protein